MKPSPLLAASLAIGLLVISVNANSQGPSTLKLKDGKTVTGTITGTIVQRESGPAKEGDPAGYGGLYYVAQGEQIERIDEAGVHYRPGTRLRYLLVGQKTALDDLEVVRTAIAMDTAFDAMFKYSSKYGGAGVKTDFKDMNEPAKLALIGEYKKDGPADQIVPMLTVTTPRGPVTVHIADLVAFVTK